jgi:hypothetical protein
MEDLGIPNMGSTDAATQQRRWKPPPRLPDAEGTFLITHIRAAIRRATRQETQRRVHEGAVSERRWCEAPVDDKLIRVERHPVMWKCGPTVKGSRRVFTSLERRVEVSRHHAKELQLRGVQNRSSPA